MSLFHMNFVLPTMQQSDITKPLAMLNLHSRRHTNGRNDDTCLTVKCHPPTY